MASTVHDDGHLDTSQTSSCPRQHSSITSVPVAPWSLLASAQTPFPAKFDQLARDKKATFFGVFDLIATAGDVQEIHVRARLTRHIDRLISHLVQTRNTVSNIHSAASMMNLVPRETFVDMIIRAPTPPGWTRSQSRASIARNQGEREESVSCITDPERIFLGREARRDSMS